jgi:hypothetical protein
MKLKKVFPLIAMSIIVLMGSCKKDETSTLSPLSPGISSAETPVALSAVISPIDKSTILLTADTKAVPTNNCTIKKWRLGESNP